MCVKFLRGVPSHSPVRLAVLALALAACAQQQDDPPYPLHQVAGTENGAPAVAFADDDAIGFAIFFKDACTDARAGACHVALHLGSFPLAGTSFAIQDLGESGLTFDLNQIGQSPQLVDLRIRPGTHEAWAMINGNLYRFGDGGKAEKIAQLLEHEGNFNTSVAGNALAFSRDGHRLFTGTVEGGVHPGVDCPQGGQACNIGSVFDVAADGTLGPRQAFPGGGCALGDDGKRIHYRDCGDSNNDWGRTDGTNKEAHKPLFLGEVLDFTFAGGSALVHQFNGTGSGPYYVVPMKDGDGDPGVFNRTDGAVPSPLPYRRVFFGTAFRRTALTGSGNAFAFAGLAHGVWFGGGSTDGKLDGDWCTAQGVVHGQIHFDGVQLTPTNGFMVASTVSGGTLHVEWSDGNGGGEKMTYLYSVTSTLLHIVPHARDFEGVSLTPDLTGTYRRGACQM